MTVFYIIRHAQKEQGDFYNPRLRHQAEPVTQTGQEQAHKLWSYFCDKGISAIYVSGYQRTAQTIEEHVAKQSGITPIMDESLNEIDNGCVEGLTDEEIQQKYPEVWRGFHERSTDFRFPQGETGEEARQRIAIFLKRSDSFIPLKISFWSATRA